MSKRRQTTLTLEQSRWTLSTVWFIGAGLILFLLIAQSLFREEFRNDLEKLWSWILPTLIPTLSLIISVHASTALNPGRDRNKVKRKFHILTLWITIAYLSILFLTIVLQPLTGRDLFELFAISNYWIAPMQGLVIGATGTLFFNEQPSSSG